MRRLTDEEYERDACINWRLLREAVAYFARDAAEQTADLSSVDGFDWEVAYPGSLLSEEEGWICPQLREHLDAINVLLERLSDDRSAWSPEAIASHPLWHEVRAHAREALELMPVEPWA